MSLRPFSSLARYVHTVSAFHAVAAILLLGFLAAIFSIAFGGVTYYNYRESLQRDVSLETRGGEFASSDARLVAEMLEARALRFQEAKPISRFASLFR